MAKLTKECELQGIVVTEKGPKTANGKKQTGIRRPEPETWNRIDGELAQLGERLLCKQEVTGSIPVFST